MNELAILSKAMIAERKDILLSILGGFIAGAAGVALFSASGYLISQTVFMPPLYTLIVLTSLVKLLGLLRAASRYGERLYSHRATFSMLSRLRTGFCQADPVNARYLEQEPQRRSACTDCRGCRACRIIFCVLLIRRLSSSRYFWQLWCSVLLIHSGWLACL